MKPYNRDKDLNDTMVIRSRSNIRSQRYHLDYSCCADRDARADHQRWCQVYNRSMEFNHNDEENVAPIFFYDQDDDNESEENTSDELEISDMDQQDKSENEVNNLIGEADYFSSDQSDQVNQVEDDYVEQKEGFVQNVKEIPIMYPKYVIFENTFVSISKHRNVYHTILLNIFFKGL